MTVSKRVVILGSSGSIGRNTLKVVDALAPSIEVVGLAVKSDFGCLLEQAARYGVKQVSVVDEEMAERCRVECGGRCEVHSGPDGLVRLASMAGVDMVVCAVVGMSGLRPVMAALKAGRDVALASKEVLVAAGAAVVEQMRKSGARILPVDSEHSAILQCLGPDMEASLKRVRRLWLTGSGGPFGRSRDVDLSKVTVEEALNHPRWRMGRKISIDSATMMNKGLEIIEAQWLFGVSPDRIGVLIHPESVVHSLVEYVDGSMLAQLSEPDMRLAIQYAITYPERMDGSISGVNLARVGTLNFLEPDYDRFPALGLARAAAERGGTMPAVLNAANEAAVEMFLEGRIPFVGIAKIVESVMNEHDPERTPGIEEIEAADEWARDRACAV